MKQTERELVEQAQLNMREKYVAWEALRCVYRIAGRTESC